MVDTHRIVYVVYPANAVMGGNIGLPLTATIVGSAAAITDDGLARQANFAGTQIDTTTDG
jgi:hypothetical protein